MPLNSCIYQGWVKHQRLRFKPYQFRYRVFMLLLDLDEMEFLFKKHWLWSSNGFNWAEFRESDYLKSVSIPEDSEERSSTTFQGKLKQRVIEIIRQAGEDYDVGRICLLTQMRYLGFRINPVSFFYCYEKQSNRLMNIIAEVNNTPWDQQHLYVLKSQTNSSEIFQVNDLKKIFHVSPFMPMEMNYRMRFSLPSQHANVCIKNYQSGRLQFKAIMKLNRSPITSLSLAKGLSQFPLTSLKVFAAIYWQALKLYLRGAKYFPNEKKVKPIFSQNES